MTLSWRCPSLYTRGPIPLGACVQPSATNDHHLCLKSPQGKLMEVTTAYAANWSYVIRDFFSAKQWYFFYCNFKAIVLFFLCNFQPIAVQNLLKWWMQLLLLSMPVSEVNQTTSVYLVTWLRGQQMERPLASVWSSLFGLMSQQNALVNHIVVFCACCVLSNF